MPDDVVETIKKRLSNEEEETLMERHFGTRGGIMAEDLERFMKPFSIGYNVFLEGEGEYYEVRNRQPFNVDKTYTELQPGNEIGRTEEDIIEPSDDAIYQVEVGVKHNVKVDYWQPSSTRGLGTDQEPEGYITQEISPYDSPNGDYTLFMPPEESLHINIENISSLIAFEPEIRYTGYKYDVTRLDSKPNTFIRLPTESFGG